jgi:beta-galactosidase beta subunit
MEKVKLAAPELLELNDKNHGIFFYHEPHKPSRTKGKSCLAPKRCQAVGVTST